MQNSFGYLKHTLLKVSIVLRLSSDKLILASIRAACVYIYVSEPCDKVSPDPDISASGCLVQIRFILVESLLVKLWFAKVPV